MSATGEREAGACPACLRRGALTRRTQDDACGRRLTEGELDDDRDELDQHVSHDRIADSGGRDPVQSLCRHSSAYPSTLLRLHQPPAVLYCRGGLDWLTHLLSRPAVTIVGGRQATRYALEVAATLGRRIAGAGVTVVSGLALGVDAAAHRGATSTGAGVLAVLASGADVPYPSTNRSLYRKLLADGAVVSEMPPGTRPARWAFPARNRIMAALGSVCVVVEAGERSGSLITARIATDLGQDVGAVPGQVTAERARGSNRLLRDGATPVLDADDVLDILFGPGRDASGGPRGRPAAGEADRRVALESLDPEVRRVLVALDSARGVDAIGREAGVAPGPVRAALGRLELLGLVKRDGLGRYERSAASLDSPLACAQTPVRYEPPSRSRAPTPAAGRESRPT